MIEEIQKYIRSQKLFPPGTKVLLAVSGGVDSVVLCELFHRCRYRFAMAHCNFRLRGKESDGDEKFVRHLAEKYKVECYSIRFDTEDFASRQKLSLQEAARNLRYEWFEKIMHAHRFTCLATAHHQNDSTETFFINLLRGTGLEGLKGIPPKNGKIVRPLLFATRSDIEVFAQKQKLKWRHDRSNDSADYLRNRIRQELIPLLDNLQPSFEKVMQKNRQHFAEAWNILDGWASEKSIGAILQTTPSKLTIDLAALPKNEAAFLLYYLLKNKGFHRNQTDAMLEASPKRSAGRIFYSENFEALADRNHLEVRKKKKPADVSKKITSSAKSIQLPAGTWNVSKRRAAGFKIPRKPGISCLDLAKLTFPLAARPWKAGDAFYPLGMKGRKKVSDFLVDNKISRFEKENIFVILSGDDIVCIPGYRIDDRFKVTTRTKDILVIEKSSKV